MKAIRIHGYGDASAFRVDEVDKPAPGPGEMLIRLHAASINHFDVMLMERRPDTQVPRAAWMAFLFAAAKENRPWDAIAREMGLSGMTPQQAVETYRKEAIRAGLIPTLNQMMIVGVVTLPGMITGQLLSGIDPLNAASYQILIMFMIAFANLTTTVLVTQGVARQFFNAQAQLQLP